VRKFEEGYFCFLSPSQTHPIHSQFSSILFSFILFSSHHNFKFKLFFFFHEPKTTPDIVFSHTHTHILHLKTLFFRFFFFLVSSPPSNINIKISFPSLTPPQHHQPFQLDEYSTLPQPERLKRMMENELIEKFCFLESVFALRILFDEFLM